MPDQYWEIPAPRFIGVPAIGAGGSHLMRNEIVAPMGNLKSLRLDRPQPHALLPQGCRLAREREYPGGLVLVSPEDERIGLYQPRAGGMLLRLHKSVQGRGLGARFLAACVDLESAAAGRLQWVPGSYSDAGLATSLSAYRLLINHAVASGRPVPIDVIQQIDWTPPVLRACTWSDKDMARLGTLAGEEIGYKEILAVAALATDRQARLLALEDTVSPGRPYTFLLELDGVGSFQGAQKVTRQQALEDAIGNPGGTGQRYTVEQMRWRAVTLEQICDHKNFDRDAASALLAKALAEPHLLARAVVRSEAATDSAIGNPTLTPRKRTAP